MIISAKAGSRTETTTLRPGGSSADVPRRTAASDVRGAPRGPLTQASRGRAFTRRGLNSFRPGRPDARAGQALDVGSERRQHGVRGIHRGLRVLAADEVAVDDHDARERVAGLDDARPARCWIAPRRTRGLSSPPCRRCAPPRRRRRSGGGRRRRSCRRPSVALSSARGARHSGAMIRSRASASTSMRPRSASKARSVSDVSAGDEDRVELRRVDVGQRVRLLDGSPPIESR